MPDVLESPRVKPIGIPFNPDTASRAGQRSGQARRVQAAILARKPIDISALQPIDRVERATNAQLAFVDEQLKRTRLLLNDDKYQWCPACERGGIEPHHRAQLLKALDTLLDRQRKLLNIPDPAPRKYGERSARGAMIELRPMLGDVQPAPVSQVQPAAPARPLGWEYEDHGAATPQLGSTGETVGQPPATPT